MTKLEVRVNTDPRGRDRAFNIEYIKSTFRAFLFTETGDGRMILSEAHFVDGRNEVKPLGIYHPGKDIVSDIGSVTYRLEPIAAEQLQSVTELVYRHNFG